MLNGSCREFSNFCDRLAVQLCNEVWLNVCFEKLSNTGLSNGVIRNLLLVCVIEFGCSKRVFLLGSYSVPFCLRTEMKNLDKRRSSSLAGMFSIALDSFSDSQNFFHAFKSLLVLYWVFFYFCSCKNFSISTSSLLVASSAGLKFANVWSFSLPASSWRSTDSSS